MDSITITLGTTNYKIAPFTFNQVRRLHACALRVPPADTAGDALVEFLWQRNLDVLVTALSRSHPDVTAEKLAELEVGTLGEVQTACDECLIFSGLAERRPAGAGAPPAGEAERAPA